MKNILLLSVVIVSLFISCSTEATQLTYYTEHQVQQQSDYIQIGITVHCQDSILKKAVQTAGAVVLKLQKIVVNYCNSQTKKKAQCQDAFESSKHNIEPKYQLVRKVQTFIAFVVKHEITIKIMKLDGIGKMTDQLLQAGDGLITIDSFEWKSQNEENPQKQALKSGMQDGKQICQKMGLKLSRVISVEQVEDIEENQENEQQQEEGGQEEQEQQQEAEIIVFKFDVECV